MLYYLELNFKSKPNMQHYSYTYAKFHVFDEIHYDFIKENTKMHFLTFLPVFTLKIP